MIFTLHSQSYSNSLFCAISCYHIYQLCNCWQLCTANYKWVLWLKPLLKSWWASLGIIMKKINALCQRLNCTGKSVSLAYSDGFNEKHFNNSIPALSDSPPARLISFSMWICYSSCKYHTQPSLLPSANSACKWTAERTVFVWSEKESIVLHLDFSDSCHSISGFKWLKLSCCWVQSRSPRQLNLANNNLTI